MDVHAKLSHTPTLIPDAKVLQLFYRRSWSDAKTDFLVLKVL